MSATISEALLLGRLIDGWISRIQRANALRNKMQAEGRTELTSEELAELQGEDDVARQGLVDAIARAKTEGR